MLRSFQCADKYLLMVALCISSCAMSGCVESTFDLASESRLPKWITLPAGLTRADVSVTLIYYTGTHTKFILKDKKGNNLAEIDGKATSRYPLLLRKPQQEGDRDPPYEVVVANGITEVIEHKRMEPIFYVNDDPAVRKALLTAPWVDK